MKSLAKQILIRYDIDVAECAAERIYEYGES